MSLLHRRFTIDHVIALLANKCRNLLKLLLRVFTLYQPRIERGLGRLWDNILRLVADVSAAHAANVEGRPLYQFDQLFPASFGLRNAELALEFRVIRRHLCESLLFVV